jgi:hypothetical protein
MFGLDAAHFIVRFINRFLMIMLSRRDAFGIDLELALFPIKIKIMSKSKS